MINEDYCSYEVAKLLKEKGFDYQGFDYIDFEGEVIRQDRPTHQMAMKWLREVYDIKIMIRPYVDGTYSYEILNGFWYVNFDSYENAVEESIKYCLKNLVK